MAVDEESKKLPNIYWSPKLHKHLCKARFIIAAPQCSVKPLSKAVTSVLKLMYKQIETYNSKIHYFSGVKSFWPIQKNQLVIDSIKNTNSRNKALSIATYENSTLDTNTPHNKLKNVMRVGINFCFKGEGKTVYCCNKIWCNMD